MPPHRTRARIGLPTTRAAPMPGGIHVEIAGQVAPATRVALTLAMALLRAPLGFAYTVARGTAIALDIGADDAPQKLVSAAKAQGGWDVIVHNAGITRDKTIANMKEHLWRQVVNINLSAQEHINAALLAAGAASRRRKA